MSEHENDDEIRESIPSVSQVYWDGVYCLPVGYGLRNGGGVYLHGRKLDGVLHEAGAWDHAVAREKARRQREGQAKALEREMCIVAELDVRDAALARACRERDTARMERDKATAMLAEVIRERDGLNGVIEGLCDVRDRLRIDLACASSQRDTASSMLSDVTLERDALREKLERVRGLQRWQDDCEGAMYKAADGDYVFYSHIARIIGKDGEG